MELTAYRAGEANRRSSRVLAALNAALLAALFPIAVWILGPDAIRPVSLLLIFLGSAMFGGREVMVQLLGGRPLLASEEPRFFRRLDAVSIGVGLRRLPAVYLVVSPQANAFVIERLGQAGTLVVTNRLLDLSDDELDAVLAHELFHLATAFVGLRSVTALFRGLVMAVAETRVRWHLVAVAIIVGLALWAFGPAPVVLALFLAVFLVADAQVARQREYFADAQAVLITRHPEALIRALRHLSADPIADRIAPRARTMTADAERLASSLWTVRPAGSAGGRIARLFDAHPSTADRIRRAQKMA